MALVSPNSKVPPVLESIVFKYHWYDKEPRVVSPLAIIAKSVGTTPEHKVCVAGSIESIIGSDTILISEVVLVIEPQPLPEKEIMT